MAPSSIGPFDRQEWFGLLASSERKPLIAVASEDGVHAAVVLTENAGHITPLKNWYSFVWRPFAPDGEVGDRLLLAIARDIRKRGHRVTLEPVPEEEASYTRLANAFEKAGWRVQSRQCDINHVLNVNGLSFAEYWAERPGRMRTTLKRKGKRVSVRITQQFDKTAWADYEHIYAQSWKPAEDEPAMLREFARTEGNAGRLRLGLAYHDDLAVAAQCWTVENGTAYIHKLAHLESHKNLSAGTTLSAAMFEHVIDKDRVEVVDFGTGDQPYKADWMGETRARYRIDCLDPTSIRSWPALGKRMAMRVIPMLAQSKSQG